MRHAQIPSAERRLRAAWALLFTLMIALAAATAAAVIGNVRLPMAMVLVPMAMLSLLWVDHLRHKIAATKAWFGEA